MAPWCSPLSGSTGKRSPIGSRNLIDVTLERSSNTSLNEAVVIGYGTQRRGDLTAPITTVNTENMIKRTTATPMEALQGSVPGVQIVSSGSPGSSPNVRVRGIGSFNNENPLYVVDGMFVDDIGFLNPTDIAEMSILKDASGAAIYGVRAANGVVLVTTKRGKIGRQLTYNGSYTWQTPSGLPRSLDAIGYMTLVTKKYAQCERRSPRIYRRGL